MVHQPVNHGCGHLCIIEDACPATELQIGGNHYARCSVVIVFFEPIRHLYGNEIGELLQLY